MKEFNFIKNIIPKFSNNEKKENFAENPAVLAYINGKIDSFNLRGELGENFNFTKLFSDPEVKKIAKKAFTDRISEEITLLVEPEDKREERAKEYADYLTIPFEKAKEISQSFNSDNNFFKNDPELIKLTETAVVLSLQNFLVSDFGIYRAISPVIVYPKEILASPRVQNAAKNAIILALQSDRKLHLVLGLKGQFELPDSIIASLEIQEALNKRIKKEEDYLSSLSIDERLSYDDGNDVVDKLKILKTWVK